MEIFKTPKSAHHTTEIRTRSPSRCTEPELLQSWLSSGFHSTLGDRPPPLSHTNSITMSGISPTGNNAAADAVEDAAGASGVKLENGNGVAAAEATAGGDQASGEGNEGVGDVERGHDSKDNKDAGKDINASGNSAKSNEGQTETVGEGASSSTEPTGAPRSIKVEELPAAVRARMDEVLHVENDKTMRQDTRLINFLGEVEESQVSVLHWTGVQRSESKCTETKSFVSRHPNRPSFGSNLQSFYADLRFSLF